MDPIKAYRTYDLSDHDAVDWSDYSRIKQAANEAALTDPRIVAVRADSLVGRGSCTTIDEAMEHVELLDALDGVDFSGTPVQTPEGAVKWAYDYEGLRREQGTNASSGEPDCPLIAADKQWREAVEDG